MAERKFTTYDGVKFREYTGKEIDNTGHYQIEVDKIKDITISGNYLDSQANRKEFKKMFYSFINAKSLASPRSVYNFILIGKDYLKSFHRFVITNTPPLSEKTIEDLFEGFLDELQEIGLVNVKPKIEQGKNYKRMKITMTTKNPPYKNFDIYLIPLDKNSIEFTTNVIDEEDVQ